MEPHELHCDIDNFHNYAGVEEHATTEVEMQNHIDKHHVAAFDTYPQLQDYTGGTPILSKLGIIEKSAMVSLARAQSSTRRRVASNTSQPRRRG